MATLIRRNGRVCRRQCSSTLQPSHRVSTQPQLPLTWRTHGFSHWRCSGLYRAPGKSTLVLGCYPTLRAFISTTTPSYISKLEYLAHARRLKSMPLLDQVHNAMMEYIKRNNLVECLSVLDRFHSQHGRHARLRTYNKLLYHAIRVEDTLVVERVLDYLRHFSLTYNSLTYSLLFWWYAKTAQKTAMIELWNRLKVKPPKRLTSALFTMIFSAIRRLKLGSKITKSVLLFVKQENISLDTLAYRELFDIFIENYDFQSLDLVYQHYIARFLKGRLYSFIHNWRCIVRVYARANPKLRWMHILEDAVQRIKQCKYPSNVIQDINFWEKFLFDLHFCKNHRLFDEALRHIAENLQLQPTLRMLNLYCQCILRRSMAIRLDWALECIELVQVKTTSRRNAIQFPTITDVSLACNRVKLLASKYGLKLDSECYNIMLAALAISRNYDELITLMQELVENKQFKLNTFGYIAQIIVATNLEEMGVARLEFVEALSQRAREAPLPLHVLHNKCTDEPRTHLLGVLLCAYAKLDAPEKMVVSLCRAMKPYAPPISLYKLIHAFDMDQKAMDRLIGWLNRYCPRYNAYNQLQAPYFFACMMDIIKRGELTLDTDNTAIDPQARLQELESKMGEALSRMRETIKKATLMNLRTFRLNSNVFGFWTRLLAHRGDYDGVRAIISLVLQNRREFKRRKPQRAMSWYWSSLISALVNANKLDEALAVLDEMKTQRGKVPLVHYKQLIIAICSEVRDEEERSKKVFELYDRMLKDSLKPDVFLLKLMRSVFAERPDDTRKVIKEAKKYEIAL